jgi:hypothetical protein
MFKEIHFYNCGHNGDIHLSRGIVKNIIEHYPDATCYYHHDFGPKILQDMPIIYCPDSINYEDIVTIIDDKLFINTWVGKVLPNNKQLCSTWGCNCEAIKELLNHILTVVKKDKFLANEFDVIPSIDFTKFDVSNIDKFLKNNFNKKILICNGDCWAGQCVNFSFEEYIIDLSIKYENIDFILTHKKNIIKNNIFYTDDIIKNDKSDLNEISYLSCFCSIIVGRASGPNIFSQIFENLIDKNKTFIVFTHQKMDAFLTEKTLCNKIWSNNYSSENIFNIIDTELSKL